MPHAAFEGQTPNEMFFGAGHAATRELANARKAAREERMKANLAARCRMRVGEAGSEALLLQRTRSRML